MKLRTALNTLLAASVLLASAACTTGAPPAPDTTNTQAAPAPDVFQVNGKSVTTDPRLDVYSYDSRERGIHLRTLLANWRPVPSGPEIVDYTSLSPEAKKLPLDQRAINTLKDRVKNGGQLSVLQGDYLAIRRDAAADPLTDDYATGEEADGFVSSADRFAYFERRADGNVDVTLLYSYTVPNSWMDERGVGLGEFFTTGGSTQVFDLNTSEAQYQQGYGTDASLNTLRAWSARSFDPTCSPNIMSSKCLLLPYKEQRKIDADGLPHVILTSAASLVEFNIEGPSGDYRVSNSYYGLAAPNNMVVDVTSTPSHSGAPTQIERMPIADQVAIELALGGKRLGGNDLVKLATYGPPGQQ